MGLKRETDRQPKYLTPAGDRKQTDRHAVLLCFPPAGHGQKEMLQVSDVCQKQGQGREKKEKKRETTQAVKTTSPSIKEKEPLWYRVS
jgi:hypothetical protein